MSKKQPSKESTEKPWDYKRVRSKDQRGKLFPDTHSKRTEEVRSVRRDDVLLCKYKDDFILQPLKGPPAVLIRASIGQSSNYGPVPVYGSEGHSELSERDNTSNVDKREATSTRSTAQQQDQHRVRHSRHRQPSGPQGGDPNNSGPQRRSRRPVNGELDEDAAPSSSRVAPRSHGADERPQRQGHGPENDLESHRGRGSQVPVGRQPDPVNTNHNYAHNAAEAIAGRR